MQLLLPVVPVLVGKTGASTPVTHQRGVKPMPRENVEQRMAADKEAAEQLRQAMDTLVGRMHALNQRGLTCNFSFNQYQPKAKAHVYRTINGRLHDVLVYEVEPAKPLPAGHKVYGGCMFVDGKQVRAFISAKSMAEVSRLTGHSAHYLRDHWCPTGNATELRFAAQQPGVLLHWADVTSSRGLPLEVKRHG